MGQNRWVSYIFRYRDGARCENAGFIKVQQLCKKSEERARIQIGLRLYKRKSCISKIYLLNRNYKTGYIGEMGISGEETDTLMKKIELPWKNCLGEGLDIREYQGLVFLCDDGEILMGIWGTEQVVADRIDFTPDSKKTDEQQIDITVSSNEDTKTDVAKEETMNEGEQTACTCQEMIDTFPKLPLFPGSCFTECVKIVPQDIGRLPIGNWRLGSNSFLSHGYYQYRYLMMGIVKYKDKDRYVIGIPGVYNGKEKYLANMFGFNLFIPVKPTKVLTGNFGYWIWEVSRI